MMLAWNILQLALLMLMAAKLRGHSLCRDTTKNCDNDGTEATQAPTTPKATTATKDCGSDGTKATQAPTTPQASTAPQATASKPMMAASVPTKNGPCPRPCEFSFCAAHPEATCKPDDDDPCKTKFYDANNVEITHCEGICGRKPEMVDCYPFGTRWFFNLEEQRCRSFIGCGGNKDHNNFDSEAKCMQTCKDFKGTQCSSDCPAKSQPHCAGDGKTYDNLCKLNVAKCRSEGTLRKLYPSPCRPKNPPNCKDPCTFAYCSKVPNSFCQTVRTNLCAAEFYHLTTKRFERNCEDICGLKPVSGDCWSSDQRWYYDAKERRCKTFDGCEGNKHQNNFDTEAECMQTCKDFQGTKCAEECPDERNEYCATNGKTFKNLCLLNVAICRSKGKIGFKHKGACGSKCD